MKHWTLEKKFEIFLRLLERLREPGLRTLPCLRLLQGLIKDQGERVSTYIPQSIGSYPSSSVTSYSTVGALQAQGGIGYSSGATGGAALRVRASDTVGSMAEDPQGLNVEGTGESE